MERLDTRNGAGTLVTDACQAVRRLGHVSNGAPSVFGVKRDLGVQGLRRDAENLRRLGFVAAGGCQRPLDRLSLGLGQGYGPWFSGLVDDSRKAKLLEFQSS